MSQNEKEILLAKYAEATRQLSVVTAELQEANKKLKEYEEKAQAAMKESRMKSLFLANMSHEIRTPLNAIEGFSRIMVETDSPEERLGYMEIIESNNTRLLSLVNEILDLSRVESGEIVIKKEATSLDELMDSIKQIFKFRCPETVSLTFCKPQKPVTMMTDANRLTQVFSNLISNALKHTPKGSITYGYDIINDGKSVLFFVKDTGSGIDPKFIDHIFDTYASKDADQQQGFGLGLALCKIIVEKMDGTISVKSAIGKGSTFSIEMPFHGTFGDLSTSNRTIANMQTVRVSQNLDESSKKTILVAEDEESNYELVRIVLQQRYRLLHAHNGIEAVNINEEEKPDLILMDIRMPEMDGLDASRIIKEVDSETPIIALSAYAFEENIREAKEAGCDSFLPKPFRVEDLIATVQKYLGE